MTRYEAVSKLKTTSVIFIIIGVIMLGIGFFKIWFYENPSSRYNSDYLYDDEDSINAYVGGDAYNYIINGTYFTAFSVLGTGSILIAMISRTAAVMLSVENPKTEEKVTVLQDIENNLPKM